MNRKLLNGLLLLSVATGGVATFTSCKDTEDGLRNEVLVGQKTLGDQLEAIRKVTDDTFKQNLNQWLDNRISEVSEGDYDSLKALLLEFAAIQGDILALQARDVELQGEIDKIWDCILDDLSVRLQNLEDWKGEVIEWQAEVDSKLEEAYAMALANKEAIEVINEKLAEFDGKLSDLQAEVDAIKEQNAEILRRLEAAEFNIAANTEAINKLNEDMASLYSVLSNKFAHLITGVNVNQTWNPLFGTLNLPVGLQSNLLAGYIFSSDHTLTFPSTDPSVEYWPGNPALSNATAQVINQLMPVQNRYKVGNGGNVLIGDPDMAPGNNNMGMIYLSLNPQNVRVPASGLNVQLINSQGQPVLKKQNLVAVPDYDKVLDFGYTREDVTSTLYRVDVGMTDVNWSDINDIAFEITEKGQLAEALKDAVKQHTASDFAHLGKLIYQHLDGFLPAYALKVCWDDQNIDGTSEQNAVISNFNIAATVVRPLSFATGFGASITNRQLPLISPVKELIGKIIDKIRNEFNFQFDKVGGYEYITIDPISVDINLGMIDINLAGAPVYNDKGQQIGTTGDYHIYLTQTGTSEYELYKDNAGAGQLDAIASELQRILNDENISLADVEKQVNNLIQTINDQLNDIRGSINDKLTDAENRINAAIQGKIPFADNLIDLYNKLAVHVNEFLKDPNHYLQPFMAYNTGSGLHHMSNVLMEPTGFVRNGGEVIDLFPTSYNAELIVPIFKKYIAITGVYYPQGVAVPEGTFNLAKINEAAGLNKIFEGRQQRVAIDVTNAQYFVPGLVYEVYYTALDYRGFTSTSKYYFYIAK